MLLIEFAGPSCAGKSTLIERLQERLRAEGVAAKAVDARWIWNRRHLYQVLRDPRIALWCVLNARIVWKWRSPRLLLGGIGAIRRLRNEPGVLLLDEGPIRTYQDVSVHRPRGDRLIRAAAPRPDVLVIVSCDPQVRLKRIRATDRPAARGRSDAEVLDRMSGEGVARAFAQAQGTRVIEIDATEGGIDVDLLQELRPWLAAGGREELGRQSEA